MRIILRDEAKNAIKELIELIDENSWDQFYAKLSEWAYAELDHPLLPTDIGQITRFLEEDIKCDILTHLSKIPASFHFADNNLTSFEIPDHIQLIEDSAFTDCRRLSQLKIPVSIKAINDKAFYGCTDLEYIHYNGTIDEWGNIAKGRKYWTRGNNWDSKFIICTDGVIEKQ